MQRFEIDQNRGASRRGAMAVLGALLAPLTLGGALASEVFGWQPLARDANVEVYWSTKQSGGKKGDINVILVTLDKYAAPRTGKRMDGTPMTYYGVIYTDMVSCRSKDGTPRPPKSGPLRQWAILSPNVLADDIKTLDVPLPNAGDFKEIPPNSPFFPLVTRLCAAL